MKPLDRVALVLAVAIAFLAIGAVLWPLAYREVSLPNTLFGPGLAILGALAAGVRLRQAIGFWVSTLAIGAAAPAAVMARIVVETAVDPTSHNLWPFELILTAGVSLPTAALGALIGGLIAPWWRSR